VVAVDSVDAALCGVGEDVLVEGGLADALGYTLFFGERLARGFIFYEFDAEEEAESSDFTDVRMRAERGQFGAKSLCGGLHAFEKFV
jgi:hypothetical protein